MDVGGQVFSHGSGCTQETAGSSTTHKAARVTAVTQGLSHNSGASIGDSLLCPAKDTHTREILSNVPKEVDTPPLVARAGAACFRHEHFCSEGQEKRTSLVLVTHLIHGWRAPRT